MGKTIQKAMRALLEHMHKEEPERWYSSAELRMKIGMSKSYLQALSSEKSTYDHLYFEKRPNPVNKRYTDYRIIWPPIFKQAKKHLASGQTLRTLLAFRQKSPGWHNIHEVMKGTGLANASIYQLADSPATRYSAPYLERRVNDSRQYEFRVLAPLPGEDLLDPPSDEKQPSTGELDLSAQPSITPPPFITLLNELACRVERLEADHKAIREACVLLAAVFAPKEEVGDD
jgi:hypothetical protein